MDQIHVKDLEALSQKPGGWCVSIYMPTERVGVSTKQNPIRFKQLINQAEEDLKKLGFETNDIKDFFDPAYTLLRDDTFWQHQQQGLAVLLSKEDFRTLQLPYEVDTLYTVKDHFYLKPLLELLYEGGDFYILALSQNEIRLLKGNPSGVNEVDLKDTPTSLAEAMRLYDGQEHLQWHSGTVEPKGQAPGQAQGTQRPAMYHGQGGGEMNKKDYLLQYFQKVDAGLNEMLRDSLSPLVLAGVEFLLPIYKEANSYQHLVEQGITGNPDDLPAEQLYQKAWTIVKPVFERTKQEIYERFKQLSGWNDKRATTDMNEVIKAAPFGRVEVLFLDKNAKQWGDFNKEKNEVKLEEEAQPNNRDLLDYAAIQTLANGGIVYAVEAQEVPGGGSPVAAILRY